MKVFLVHGMGRSRASLLLLRARLAKAGFDPELFGYGVAREGWSSIVERFVQAVSLAVQKSEPYGIVGHSLGNVIARAASPRLPAGLRAIVMLAPPNQPPLLAAKLSKSRVFKLFTGESGQNLATPAFYETLPIPAVPTLVLAGTRGPRASWLPHGDEPTDGVVSVSETRLEGATHREIAALHTLIMNQTEVARLTAEFLSRPS